MSKQGTEYGAAELTSWLTEVATGRRGDGAGGVGGERFVASKFADKQGVNVSASVVAQQTGRRGHASGRRRSDEPLRVVRSA